VQEHYDGEEWYLQLDAHHRFVEGWDDALKMEIARCPATQPVVTAYLPHYGMEGGVAHFPSKAPAGSLVFSHFDADGIAHIRADGIPPGERAQSTAARFLSAHFLFSSGALVEQVPYDPELYFYGEEVSLAARAFTNGFDLFHPSRLIAWHHYGRDHRPRHWDDHSQPNGSRFHWGDYQRKSVEKWRALFCPMPFVSPHGGLGIKRTLAQYEAWSGVNYHWRVVHPETIAGNVPPSAKSAGWEIEHGLLVESSLAISLPELVAVDHRPCSSVYLAVRDATPRDAAILRLPPAEYAELQRTGWKVTVRYRRAPLSIVVWPLLESGEWGSKYEMVLVPGRKRRRVRQRRC
jgi:hypothetical protein